MEGAHRSLHVQDEEALQIQALQSAIWYTTSHLVDAASLELGMTTSSHFITSLAALVYAQIQTLGEDVESFAKHRGGKVVNIDDVLLCTRRNEGLHKQMSEYAKQVAVTVPESRGKRKENIREAVHKKR